MLEGRIAATTIRRLALASVLLVGSCAAVGAWAWSSLPPAPPADLSATHLEPVSVDLRVAGQVVRVHALPTGTIRIKRCHHDLCLPESASFQRRFLGILADDEYVEPMPIWTYLIEHPEGRFVIDTGPDPAHDDPASWSCDPVSHRLIANLARIDLRVGESLLERLAALGLGPADIDAALITHLHFDHGGGIRALGVPTYVGQGDLDNEHVVGSVPCRFLAGAELIAVEASDEPEDAGLALTSDGALRIYSTPGHTPGSLTIRLTSDRGDLWFVGDTTFDELALDPRGPTAGIHAQMPEVRALQAELGELVRTGALVLPSHDEDAGVRLRAFVEQPARTQP